jgi:DNA-binding LytR/AlgR family response regulator
MKIAICDDDKNDMAIIKEFIRKFDASLACDVYLSAVDLIKALETEFYELMFLDIEMKPLNGFDAAVQILKNAEKPLIIFVTNSSKYTIQGYEVAFRYLMKPVTYEQLEKVLAAAIEQIVPKRLMIEINGKNLLISTKDIFYFEVLDHSIKIQMRNNTYEYRGSLKSIEEMLSGSYFIRPHNSFLINLEHVVSASQTEFIMKDNHKIAISRKRKDDVFKALRQYLRR